jgi:hypothetical protein
MKAAILLLGLAAVANAAAEPTSQPAWTAVEVGRVGDLVVRLKVLKVASLIDEEWIGFEFENTGQAAVPIRYAQYQMDCDYLDPQTREKTGCGDLASGNERSLFADLLEVDQRPPIQFEPGLYRAFAGPSAEASGTFLHLRPVGVLMRARVRMMIEVDGQPRFTTPDAGVPFEFRVRLMDPADYPLLRQRLRRLLAAPRHDTAYSYGIGTLFRIPAVADALTASELLNGLALCTDQVGARNTLVKELGRRFGHDPAVLEFYAERVRAGDQPAIRDIQFETRIWDPNWVQPLVAEFERSQWPRMQFVLAVLSAHYADWPPEAPLPARLSARIVAQAPVLTSDPNALQDEQLTTYWVANARDLAATHDLARIGLVQPYLDRHEVVLDIERASLPPLMYPGPQFRVCDVALDTILMLRGEDVGAAYARVRPADGIYGRTNRPASRPASSSTRPSYLDEYADFQQSMNEVRDGMIAELKRKLDEQ